MSRGGLGRNDPCFCGSGKKYKKCCYPRTLPDFSRPNAGLPSAFEQREAIYRALSRQEAQPPQDDNVPIENVDVGRTRLLCAPLAPYGDGLALPGTLAPPTPLQVEYKYHGIRASNPDGVTEVVVTYTYPEMFGFAEARMVFDADERFELVDGRVVSVLDLFRGMNVRMADGSIGTITGNPQRRYDIPIPPLPDENGLWTSRVMGRVKHTAHEIVEFRWGRQMVRVTPGHAVWSASRRGWVGAHELYQGEMIRVAGNVVAPAEAARRVPGMIEVFGIEVEYFHNYFVGTGENAMLVHNGPECVVKPAAAEEAAAETAGNAAKKRSYVFRGDDNYRGGPVGRALGAEADAADIQNFADHVLRKESNLSSRYVSFTEEVKVARKFTSASDNRYVSKAEMAALRELEARGVIRIWDPDQVHAALREGPRKLAKQASDVRAAMRRNSEILVEGQIPEGILQPTN